MIHYRIRCKGANMRLLIYLWNSYTDFNLCDVLDQMNISYDKFTFNFNEKGHNKNNDEQFEDYFVKTYSSKKYDAAMSIDYWPPIAAACYKLNMKYIAWSYDCPLDILCPEETMCLPNVYTFLFDKHQTEEYHQKGLDNIYHMPLGANINLWKRISSKSPQCQKYKSDVSFIGKLYQNSSFSIISGLVDEKTKTTLLAIIDAQRKMPQTYMLDKLVTDSFASLINYEMHKNNPSFSDTATVKSVRFAIECEIARYDRITLLNISGNRYNTDFYSGESSDLIKNVNLHSYVDYYNEMPYIFAASRINLNPTLPAIRTGVNLRSFDITACGGFMLTNRQSELEDYFTDGTEVAVYDSIYDFVDKLDYYLSHEDERAKIALAGKNRCIESHSMSHRLTNIFNIVFS